MVSKAKEDLPEPDNAIDGFLQKKLKGETPDPKELKKVVDALMRRGHRWSDIQPALGRYEAEIDVLMEEQ